nr:hypothetical protein [Natronohydrobacter thiooxidans]
MLEALLDEIRVFFALAPPGAIEKGARGIDPDCIDQLPTQITQDESLHHDHALVIQPDAAIAKGELKSACEIRKCRRSAFFQKAAVAARGDSRCATGGFGQRNTAFHHFTQFSGQFMKA